MRGGATPMANLARMIDFLAERRSPGFPPGTVGRLLTAVAAALAVAAGGLAVLLALVNRADWWRGLLAAGVVSALASAISLLPLVWGVRHSVNAAVAGYFLAMGVRLAISLGGCLLAVHAGGYPQSATMLLMVAFYVAALAAEALVLAAAAWSMGERSGKQEAGS